MQPTRRPFESDGRFYAGFIAVRGNHGQLKKHRCLCFILADGSVVGASATFRRSEAYHAACRAANGTLPVVPVTSDTPPGVLLSAILQNRGFPIRNIYSDAVEVDDTTSAALSAEFST